MIFEEIAVESFSCGQRKLTFLWNTFYRTYVLRRTLLNKWLQSIDIFFLLSKGKSPQKDASTRPSHPSGRNIASVWSPLLGMWLSLGQELCAFCSNSLASCHSHSWDEVIQGFAAWDGEVLSLAHRYCTWTRQEDWAEHLWKEYPSYLCSCESA